MRPQKVRAEIITKVWAQLKQMEALMKLMDKVWAQLKLMEALMKLTDK